MAGAAYVRRYALVPRALEVLMHHPGGLRLATLAGQLDVSEKQLREDLLAFFAADAAGGADQLQRDVSLEFVTAEGDGDIEPADADVVRLISASPLDELGVQYVPAAEFAPLVRAALDLEALEPDNTVLAAATDRLTELMGGVEHAPSPGGEVAAALRRAAAEGHRVRIRYTRTWFPGVIDRVIDPYRVVSTRRGFECDAGPLDDGGSIRSYLVSGITACEPLAETFERPADVDERIAAARVPVGVKVVVPHRESWVVENLADRVVPAESDSDLLALWAEVLPPVRERVGLMLVMAGPEAFVAEPATLADAGAEVARRLLAHHGLADDEQA